MWPEIEPLLIWGHQQTVVQIAPARSADENIRALCFTPDGTMDDRVALIPEPCRFKGTVDFVHSCTTFILSNGSPTMTECI